MHGAVTWVKGHGTENDFILVADPDGEQAKRLDADLVRAICHRRRGVGADGLLRVVRSRALPDAEPYAAEAEWFMDFRNADGSVGEICGNGIRVFARYLISAGLVDPDASVIPVATRAGVRPVTRSADGETFTVGMGRPTFPSVDEAPLVRTAEDDDPRPATPVDVGNPHAVVFVDDVARAGSLVRSPTWEPADAFPHGANIEFVQRLGERRLRMRVYERGVGETRSCGTGATAVAATVAHVDQVPAPWTYQVEVPGGLLSIGARPDGQLEMAGPAVLTARGSFDP